MIITPGADLYTFKLFIQDKNLKSFARFQLENDIIGRVAERVLREIMPEKVDALKEPWFELIPILSKSKEFKRHPVPKGFTSLRGEEYIPEPELSEGLKLSPNSTIQFFTLIIHDTNEEIFRGDYSIEDIFRAVAEFMMKYCKEQGKLDGMEGPYHYEILFNPNEKASSKLKLIISSSVIPEQYYADQSAFQLPKLEKSRQRISFKKVEEQPFPEFVAADFSNLEEKGHRGINGKGRVILHKDVYNDLVSGLQLSRFAENGGYLLGNVFQLSGKDVKEEDPNFRWAIEVTNVVKAEGTYGNPALLLFTHDSWSQIKQLIDKSHPGKKLVSWFHTHLFPASDDFGLSGLDQTLHRRFFPNPWQVALLLNIDASGDRELRCFQRDERKNKLIESTYEVMKKD